MRFDLLIDGKPNKVELTVGKVISVDVNGEVFSAEVSKTGKGLTVNMNKKKFVVRFDDPHVIVDGRRFEVKVCNLRRGKPSWSYGNHVDDTSVEGRPTGKSYTTEGMIHPPMPGRVVAVKVKEGDCVKTGDPVLVLEAMKMQNEIISNTDGVVREIRVSVGDLVETEDTLLVIGS